MNILRRMITLFVLGCIAIVSVLGGVAWKNRTDAKWLLDAMAAMASQTDPSLELSALHRQFGKS